LVCIYHQISDITLYEVLEAILLSEVNKFFRQFALGDDRITSSGFASHIVTARISDLNVEVDKAASAPAVIIFCEIETSSIADDTLLLLIFNLIYFIV
jgi:hypothetical protein